MLSVEGDGAAVALAVAAQQVLDEAGIIDDTLFLAVVAVDEYHEVGGVDGHLRALVVAGGCTYAALCVAIDGQSCDVEHAAPDAFVGFAFAPDTQCQSVAHELIGIEAADAGR